MQKAHRQFVYWRWADNCWIWRTY